ncbi:MULTISPECIES: DUF5412 family protein [Bacillaceae]|uniref:DUF5412 domain-containing protein n=1 Tax=Domibacillus aminovorans TaxID=29332 RepID=A0A177KIG9_9BACI|nr:MULTISPECIES: DUF5412 family protein [Bacillaceae]OAH52914.1 hypothetical protein AWH48_14000 [Domibacillus aminovorans]
MNGFPLKKETIIIGWVSFSVILVIFLLIVAFNNSQYPDPEDWAKGTLEKEVPSPSNQSSIRMYLVQEGGATSRFQMRGEVVYPTQETRNIYLNYDEDRTDVQWLNEDMIIINEERLNIKEDVYFWKDDPKWEEKREKKYE